MGLEKDNSATPAGKAAIASESTLPITAEATRAKEDMVAGRTVEQGARDAQEAMRESLPKELSAEPPLIPKGYRILELLGEGTFGEVWRGQNETTKVQVAIKFFRNRSASQWQLLLEEAKKLAMLHSDPRIVRLLDVEDKTTPPYFVMDYAENGSLAGRLALRKTLPAAEALAIFRQIVEAMAYVHAKGIRHCDLKPGNVLLDAAGRPKVADFGQAHLSIDATPAALGTFFYMAPEQASTAKQIPDTRWDVFGLGALLFTMLTGRPPRYDMHFKQELENTAELSHRLDRYRRRVEATPAPTEHRRVQGVDRPLADIIDRCLAADPARRLRDAGDVLAALNTRERRRRLRPLLVFAVLAPLLLMIAAGLFGFLMVGRAAADAEKTLTEQLLQSDQITASLVANVVKDKLDYATDKLKKFADSVNMRKSLIDYLKEPAKNGVLDEQLDKLAKFETSFYSFAVLDKEGKLLSTVVRGMDEIRHAWGQHPRDVVGQSFSWRDYYNRDRDYYEDAAHPHKKFPYKANSRGGLDAPYISQPFMSRTAEGYLCIGISAPIHEDDDARQMVGLLFGAINLRDLYAWIKPVEDSHGCAVLLDRRGYCVHHLEKHRAKLEPELDKPPKRWHDQSDVFAKVLAGKSATVAQYDDPIDNESYLAAYVPVPEYGWGVIVQHNRAAALARLQEVGQDLTRYLWLAGAVSGALLSAFWGWLLWVMLRKEEVMAHG